MPYKHEFIYPEYYPKFSCKCGECRSTCCHGWGITLSRDDYFKVMGTEASPELKRRLDVAFKPAENPSPTPERFAMISYNWLGRCPIQTEDGFCLLHRERGEEAIPEICRRYPRMIRILPIHECCTSSSCERTLELLFADEGRLNFARGELEVEELFEVPAAEKMPPSAYLEIRTMAVETLSMRNLSIDERLSSLALRLGADTSKAFVPAGVTADIAERLAKNSAALREIVELCGDTLGDDYPLHLEGRYEIYLEKLLTNHIFYKSFPYSFEKSTPDAEISALALAKGLTDYFASGYLKKFGENTDNFVDVTAKLFRMIEHSRFDETAARLLAK